GSALLARDYWPGSGLGSNTRQRFIYPDWGPSRFSPRYSVEPLAVSSCLVEGPCWDFLRSLGITCWPCGRPLATRHFPTSIRFFNRRTGNPTRSVMCDSYRKISGSCSHIRSIGQQWTPISWRSRRSATGVLPLPILRWQPASWRLRRAMYVTVIVATAPPCRHAVSISFSPLSSCLISHGRSASATTDTPYRWSC